MDFQQVEKYLLSKPEVIIHYPFGDDVKVFKVKNKMFATLSLGKLDKAEDSKQVWWVNLKCDAEEAVMLRDIFSAVIPGFHMNKRLWNTVILDGSIPTGEMERMMDNSFNLVVSNMPSQDQQSILLQLES